MDIPTPTATSRIMITLSVENFNHISQRFYDDIISGLQFHMLTCPSCGHSGTLTRHAYYTRSIRTTDGIIPLRILRLKCSCGCTHAVLISSIVPYSRISLKDHIFIISSGYEPDAVAKIQLSIPEISFWSIRSICRIFASYWKERLISFGISLLDTGKLVFECFHTFSRQFMQNHIGLNQLFLYPT